VPAPEAAAAEHIVPVPAVKGKLWLAELDERMAAAAR
jgi:hypothetical protein